MRARTLSISLLVLFAAASFSAGAQQPPAEGETDPSHLAQTAEPAAPAAVTRAIALLSPTEGNSVSGTFTFTQEADGIRVHGELTGLGEGSHGFHIHEFGDCSAPDGSSAGPHFNPMQMPHAAPDAAERHVGDMGNIEVAGDGTGSYDRLDPMLSFDGPGNILGRGLIVHADPDDLTTQPTGNAGARVACGVIGVAAPPAPPTP